MYWRENALHSKTWSQDCEVIAADDLRSFEEAYQRTETDNFDYALVDTRGGGSELNNACRRTVKRSPHTRHLCMELPSCTNGWFEGFQIYVLLFSKIRNGPDLYCNSFRFASGSRNSLYFRLWHKKEEICFPSVCLVLCNTLP